MVALDSETSSTPPLQSSTIKQGVVPAGSFADVLEGLAKHDGLSDLEAPSNKKALSHLLVVFEKVSATRRRHVADLRF